MERKIGIVIKGFVIGSTMLVPGVSGASMAMILGIYDTLLQAVANFRQSWKRNAAFLLLFLLGSGVGIFALAKTMENLVSHYHLYAMYFFIGTMAGGLPMLFQKVRHKGSVAKGAWCLTGGFLISAAVAMLPAAQLSISGDMGLGAIFLLLVCGLLLAAGLVLPGISVSYLLLILGLYETTMNAIAHLNLAYLLPLGVSLGIGIILTSKLINALFQSKPFESYCFIFGFVVFSVVEVLPGFPPLAEIPACAFLLAAGFLVTFFLSRMEEKL